MGGLILKKMNKIENSTKDIKVFIFRQTLKELKKDLPNVCTFLAPYLDTNGELYVKAIVNKNEHYFSLPYDLEFSKTDVERLKNLILEKCQTEK
jgi:hypothetical protein